MDIQKIKISLRNIDLLLNCIKDEISKCEVSKDEINLELHECYGIDDYDEVFEG